MTSTAAAPRLRFEELDEMETPSWESFYVGVLSGLTVVGIAAAVAT
ncbi:MULTISPECIES: MpaA1 family daptide-type RiPP [Microbacterium]|jgi:hypothetical protein|uniref:Uncharacterized protein n=1 Tax=Microbacterium mcarthurae TaxID=3035918 RepID=A0ABW9GJ60_9MICO|nr:MpaA1 family daptide-type RiPP [Microbacterium sp. ACRRU]MCG7416377.1 hypothetical protein [Microbacterium sp. ACRRU]